jgi:hypothetical protein
MYVNSRERWVRRGYEEPVGERLSTPIVVNQHEARNGNEPGAKP